MSAPLRWKLIAGFLLVFIAGLVAGTFFGAVQARHHRLDFSRHSSLAKRVREHMQSRLDLTPEQVTQTAPILDKTASRLQEICADTARRVHDTFEETDRQLAPDLTPEQREKLKRLEAQHRAAEATPKRN